jgi:hypothetical protein
MQISPQAPHRFVECPLRARSGHPEKSVFGPKPEVKCQTWVEEVGQSCITRQSRIRRPTASPRVRHWIAARGGLTPHMIFLRGNVLQAMYKPCFLDAHHYFAVGGPIFPDPINSSPDAGRITPPQLAPSFQSAGCILSSTATAVN